MDLHSEAPENNHDFLIKMFDAKEHWVAWSGGLALTHVMLVRI